ncbi:ATP-binding protein [Parachitinimonas caeni]|uniref:histidine kinase n=1 Tax=Parachitinimonas caeni TaxID=3031301 RepID=A0ABT7DYB7_9NEIS|nr:ATP-binding protein [Parachitinimonas caeni]MDK2125058.1 ATP-binding protein [Parachitinimonas caeni]
MFQLGLRTKLMLALTSFGLVIVAALYLTVRLGFEQGFTTFVDQGQRQMVLGLQYLVQARFATPEKWRLLIDSPPVWNKALETMLPPQPTTTIDLPPAGADAGPDRDPLPPGMSVDRRPQIPIVLLNEQGQVIIGPRLPPHLLEKYPIHGTDGRLFGYLARLPVRNDATFNSADNIFFRSLQQLLLVGCGVAAILAVVLSWPLSRILLKPVQRIDEALARLAARDNSVRLPTGSNDDLGRLAVNVNLLAATLQEHSDAQRQWLTDLAHELRTPLSVLQGELEALREGVRSYDQSTNLQLGGQVGRMSRLVDELKELLLSERAAMRYEFRPVDLAELLQDELEGFSTSFKRAGIEFTFDLPAHARLQGDADKLAQLTTNLAQNSLRYTDAPGKVSIQLRRSSDGWRLLWQDSNPGVPDDALPHLFERFYRVDASRQRATGGTGLGLAIVANIVHAHNGKVSASHSPLGGLCITIDLPSLES